jgi:hypothetical protein
MLWKAVREATGWKAGRCQYVQVSDLFSMEKCDQAVMDFLAATNIGKFQPKRVKEEVQQSFFLFFSFVFINYLLTFIYFLLSKWTTGSRSGAWPSSRLARRQR